MRLAVTAIILSLLSVVMADISILFPTAGVTWWANDSVPFNWTALPTDPTFSVELISGSGQTQQIVNQVNPNDTSARISLPNLVYGDGYTIQFTNTKNTTQVLAKAGPFSILAGTPSTTTHTQSLLGATSTSAGNLPGISASPTSSANPFASSAKSAAEHLAIPGAALVLTLMAATLF